MTPSETEVEASASLRRVLGRAGFSEGGSSKDPELQLLRWFVADVSAHSVTEAGRNLLKLQEVEELYATF